MSDKNNNQVNEPLGQYEQPLSFEKVWLMFQETDKQFKETDMKFKESERLLTEKFQESRAFSDELGRRIDKLAKLYGGVSENSKDVAEEFFMRGLEKKKSILGLRYDQVGRLAKSTKKLQGEYDIVLYNGKTMVVIEVKYKLHPNDVNDFVERKLPNFRKLFPEYKDSKVLGGVAGMSVPYDSQELAKKHGLIVLTQSGENMQVMNEKGFELKVF